MTELPMKGLERIAMEAVFVPAIRELAVSFACRTCSVRLVSIGDLKFPGHE